MTKSSCDKLLDLDPEIERTFRALRNQEKISEDSESSLSSLDTPMTDHNRTMKELAAPDEAFKYSCITYPTLAGDFELRSGFITSWIDMKKAFLEKFFPASRTATIRKNICGIQSMIDAAVGGALVNKTPEQARELISSMAENSQQFGSRTLTTRGVGEVQMVSNEQKEIRNSLMELTSLVKQLALSNAIQSSIVLNVQFSCKQSVNFQQGQNFIQQALPAPSRLSITQGSSSNASNSDSQQARLEELMQQLRNLERQIGQLASNINQIQAQQFNSSSEEFPEVQNVSASSSNPILVDPLNLGHAQGSRIYIPEISSNLCPTEQFPADLPDFSKSRNSRFQNSEPSIPLPFPQRRTQPRWDVEEERAKEFQELVNLFSKVEVNVPLFTMVKQIPKYAKFLKDLCAHKKKLKGNELINLGKNVSALLQPIPHKCKDPRVFTVPCEIGSSLFKDVMLDLRASINVMSKSVFQTLGIGPLHPTGVVIKLADRSQTHLAGIIEDVLVKVRELIFPADFYILDMEGDYLASKSPLILGRPFLKTARTKFDVHADFAEVDQGDVLTTVFKDVLDLEVDDNSYGSFPRYFQICIDLEDQEKTTFTCPFSTFAYRRMPFGLCNAPGTFQ
ncbi:uncharacterized protein LOC121979717 [Zingiber officinale]|uniref:uncharacterized protein LOC121979717 n=1 Tax=Zingiber officinale TaxID=94328 RepID=UPI001C4C0FFA|nr:uncharacterized protein LOC121979717 [Zingiber officinale]